MRYLSVLVLMTLTISACRQAEPAEQRLPYPVAHKGNVVEDYAGTKVPDPYRWMEALDSAEVAQWVTASNAVTEPYLAKLPLREPLNKRLTELWNFERFGVRRIAAEGAAFDPALHEAVMELDDPEATSGTVLQVLEDGYMIHDRLLRPARVVVAKRRRAQPPLTS